MSPAKRVLITGADGFLGKGLIKAMAESCRFEAIVATDVREVPMERHISPVQYLQHDVRKPGLDEILVQYRIDSVVHLASIVTPGKDSNRDFEYEVDVLGTEKVLQACVRSGVEQIIVSSSGAAYGYHPDNPEWIVETDALRGNESFAYAHHKRLVEDMLAQYRQTHPKLRQTILRIGTILGEQVNNQITALFEKPALLAISGSPSPFVFIWDKDVTGIIMQALLTRRTGAFNVAGDGALNLKDIAHRLGKPLRVFPAWLLKLALGIGSRLGLTRYGPEQLDFLRYRPVLLNTALKTQLGYQPLKTSAQALEAFIAARQRQGKPIHTEKVRQA